MVLRDAEAEWFPHNGFDPEVFFKDGLDAEGGMQPAAQHIIDEVDGGAGFENDPQLLFCKYARVFPDRFPVVSSDCLVESGKSSRSSIGTSLVWI